MDKKLSRHENKYIHNFSKWKYNTYFGLLSFFKYSLNFSVKYEFSSIFVNIIIRIFQNTYQILTYLQPQILEN